MKFTKEHIINSGKVLRFGLDDCGLFSTEELEYLEKYTTDIEKATDKMNFRNSYLSAYHDLIRKEPHFYISYIRSLTEKNIKISYNIVPEFKNHVGTFGLLLRAARGVKFGNNSEVINLEDIQEVDVPEKEDPKVINSVLKVFKFSKELGNKGTSPKREQSAVQAKLIEEVGEHSVEIQVQNGVTYKESGSDGIAGEAVDIVICALDSFALEHPDKSPEEIYNLFQEFMINKLQKWKRTV